MEKDVLDGYIGDRTMTHIEDEGVTGKPDFALQERWREPTFQNDRSIEPIDHPIKVYQDMISDLLSA